MALADYSRHSEAASEPPASDTALRGRRILGLGLPLWALISLILVLVAASIVLFRNDFISDLDARLLTLFAIAGGLGGALRSFAYSLASGSFTERERRQWATEAVVAPVAGAVAGMLAYLVVRASLVASPEDLTREGQYLISLVAGALALRPLGSIVERGLLRSSMSRSGILGGEISPSVPLLDRIETMLEERVTESSLSNYDGWVEVTPSPVAPGQWALQVTLRSWESKEVALPVDRPQRQSARIVVTGGDERDAVLFGISVVSRTFEASPPLLSVSAPREGRAQEATIFLEAAQSERGAADAAPAPPERAVLLEVSQGTKTLTVVRVQLEGTTAVAPAPSPSPVRG
jgi:hypothetical protein